MTMVRIRLSRIHLSALAVSLLFGSLGLFPASGWSQEPAAAVETGSGSTAEGMWTSHIQPLLMEHCQKCHGGAKAEGGLDLRTLASIAQGGDRGPAIEPGNPAESLLLQVVMPNDDLVMPPDSQGLSEDDRVVLSSWIAKLSDESMNSQTGETQSDVNGSAQSSLPAADMPSTLVIDFLLARESAKNGWKPTPTCDDRSFVRRVYLDLAGRIPTTEEVEAFLSTTNSNKREELVDQLLASDDYAEHFAILFDTMLMGREGERRWRERQQHGWHDFLRTSFRENRPWNETLTKIILARPETAADKGATWFLYERDNNYQAIAEAVAPSMFGVQIQCAQCHDHPLAPEIKQGHYWGLVAFFARGKNKMTPQGPRISESAIGAYEQFTDISGNSYPNLLSFIDRSTVEESRPEKPEDEKDDPGKYLEPVALDGKTDGLPKVPKFSRRQAFSEQIFSGHSRVAPAMVNRLWALLIGRGLVHPVDKIDSVHPCKHPELLAWLARDFESHNFDIRRTVRAIVLSTAYQRQTGRPTADTPPDSFCYTLEKPLTAEVLVRSLSIGLYGKTDAPTAAVRADMASVFPDVLPEESITTLKQTLYLSNNVEFNESFDPADGSLVKQLIDLSSDEQAVQVLFERLVNRKPTTEELDFSLSFLNSRSDRRSDAIRHLVWALATSAEFRFNH